MSESRFWLSTAGKGGDFRFQPCPSREMSGVLAAAQSETPPSTLHYHNPDRVVTPDEVFGKASGLLGIFEPAPIGVSALALIDLA